MVKPDQRRIFATSNAYAGMPRKDNSSDDLPAALVQPVNRSTLEQ